MPSCHRPHSRQFSKLHSLLTIEMMFTDIFAYRAGHHAPKRLSLRCQMAYSRRGDIRGIDIYDIDTIARGFFFVNICAASGPVRVLLDPAHGRLPFPAEHLAGHRPGSGADGKNKIVGSQEFSLSRQDPDFRQRISSGDEIECALFPCEETLEFLHRIDGKRAGLGSSSIIDGTKAGMPATARLTMAYLCTNGIRVSRSLCGGSVATTKYIRESEKIFRTLLCNMQMPEMNRVECPSKNSDSGNFQPAIPPQYRSI